MTDNDPQKTIGQRIEKDKEALLEQLKKVPIISFACEKSGIGRTTYYRWRDEDPIFADKAEKSMSGGRDLINDMAESQLFTQIKNGNMTAIIFWLKNNHKIYKPKIISRNDVTIHTEVPPPEVIAEVDRLFAMNSRCKTYNNDIPEGKSLSTTKGTE